MFLLVVILVQNVGTSGSILGTDIKSLASVLSLNELDLMNVQSLWRGKISSCKHQLFMVAMNETSGK